MSSLIDENIQFTDESTGSLIVNGYIHIGAQNQDPTLVANKITIYSDRELTTTLSNPQRTGSDGRAANKIWIPGKYSLVVQDSNGTQKLSDLDAGETAQTGITNLGSVSGTNTITATGSPTITALVDKEIYNFTASGANSAAVTLQIDALAAKSVVKYHDQALASGDIELNQNVMVQYNSTDDTFELINPAAHSYVDITVSNSATVGGESVNTKAATVSNHTRAGNIHLASGGTLEPDFVISTEITEDVIETVGPTGSGADNIWTALDDLPSNATILKALLDIAVSTSGTATAYGTVYAWQGDSTATATSNNTIGSIQIDEDVGITGSSGTSSFCEIPLNSSHVFRLEYNLTGTDSALIQLIYKGFITD